MDGGWKSFPGLLLVVAALVSSGGVGYAADDSMVAFEVHCAGPPEAAAEWLQALEIEDQARQMETLRAAPGVESRIVALFKFQHLMDDSERERMLREAMAGASVQPRQLGALVLVCARLRGSAGQCDGLAERIVALEPSNAWGWMQLAGEAQRAGDREAARLALLASGRSSQYISPDRELLRMLWAARRADPPNAALASARYSRILSSQAPREDGSPRCERADVLDDAATEIIGYALASSSQHLTSLRTHCAEARPAQDAPLLHACRRLLRMVEDQAFLALDVQYALMLRSEIELPSEAGAASVRKAELESLLMELSYLAGTGGDLHLRTVSVHRLLEFRLEHGEIAEWRRLVEVLAPGAGVEDLRRGTEIP